MAEIILIDINTLSSAEYTDAFTKLNRLKSERIEKKRMEVDKRRSIAADIAARMLVSKFLDIDFSEVTIKEDCLGRPAFEGCCLSLSHSGNFAAAAIDDAPIGVDIEKIRTDIRPEVIKRVCKTDCESEYIDRACSTKELIGLWGAKEACFKAIDPQPRLLSEIYINIVNDDFYCKGIEKIITKMILNDYILSLAICNKNQQNIKINLA